MRSTNCLIGSAIPRTEDFRFVRGEGEYVADVSRERQLHAFILRSPIAHGRIRSWTIDRALKLPGVRAVVRASDLPRPLATVDIRLQPMPSLVPFHQPVLAQEIVRYTGEPLAVVLADSAAIAEDAAGSAYLTGRTTSEDSPGQPPGTVGNTFVSPTQINVQAPSDSTAGTVNVVVDNNGAASLPAPVQLQPVAPAFFMYPGTNMVVASLLPDYSLLSVAAAAKPGDMVALWGTGFGATTPAVAAGTVVAGVPAAVTPPTVTVGGMPATVMSTVLTPGSAGLYQIAIQLPANLPSGALPVVASVRGMQTQAGVTILVGTP